MTESDNKTIKYTLWNPIGNITALVEKCEKISRQPEIAYAIMQRHSDVEQVGFIGFSDDADTETLVSLRMAGGEFCGNASMCAAANGELSFGSIHAELPFVKMEGILHYIIEADSPFFALKNETSDAEKAVISWCKEDDPCIGLMFLDSSKDQPELTPLVYVPASRTLFWENSCASGSAAVGMYLASKAGHSLDILLSEPGGILGVKSDSDGKTVLSGNAKFEGSFVLSE